jgi:hypothetical protein
VVGDQIRLVLPAESRYLDVALTAMETLADRSGVDAAEIAALRARIHEVLGERVSHRAGDTLVLHFELGDGYLGVRLDGDTSYAQT